MALDAWLVVGLGNPGPRYTDTRHNAGFAVVDELAARHGQTFRRHRANAMIAETRFRPGADRVILAQPMTFMNLSGAPTAALAAYFDVPPERVLVVHDDLDLPFDTVRLKGSGGHGGHNGLRDITRALATDAYPRVRLGIGRPDGRMDPAHWVLASFSTDERKTLPNLIADAADAVELTVEDGLIAAQQRVHAPRA